MKELLLIEKANVSIAKTSNPYVLEGMFTELGEENRNGRVYTKEGFLPHLELLKKVVEQGKAVGELDHPKVFETSLKNSSHVIEKIWYNESDNKVYGRIKLLDTDAGKNAKALVDAGVPLHISSRAAGTVAENKSVKIHKLFTYDLVADPGFENAVLNTVNESYGFEKPETSNFFMYEVDSSVKESEKVSNTVTPESQFITEAEIEQYTKYTKKSIDELCDRLSELKNEHNALIKQNDEIADNINKDSIQESIDEINLKINRMTQWADHVVEEFEKLKPSNKSSDENRLKVLEDKLNAIENWSEEVTETVTALENWSEEATQTVTGIENWSEEVTETVTALENWSEEATDTVTALENWSDEATKTVSGLETWSDEATKTVTALENWSEEATNTITLLEGKKSEKIDNSLSEEYTSELYKKIDSIIDNAKKQKAEEKQELVKESNEVDKSELPLWKSMMPEKYSEMWEALSVTKKSSIEKRASICEFSNENSIKEFWDATFSSISIEMINESSESETSETNVEDASQRRLKIVEAYKNTFK